MIIQMKLDIHLIICLCSRAYIHLFIADIYTKSYRKIITLYDWTVHYKEVITTKVLFYIYIEMKSYIFGWWEIIAVKSLEQDCAPSGYVNVRLLSEIIYINDINVVRFMITFRFSFHPTFFCSSIYGYICKWKRSYSVLSNKNGVAIVCRRYIHNVQDTRLSD